MTCVPETFTQLYQTLNGALLEARVPLAYSKLASGRMLDAATKLDDPDLGESAKTIAINNNAITVEAKNCVRFKATTTKKR